MKFLSVCLSLSILFLFCSCKKDNKITPENRTSEESQFPSEEGKDTIWISNVNDLMATQSKTKAGHKLVLIKDGIYNVPDRIWLTGDNLIFRSESGNRDAVILKGKGMNGNVGFVFGVSGDNFAVRDITIGEVKYHGIQVHGELDADSIYIRNVRFYDINEQMIKASFDKNKPGNHSDYGVVEECLFEYTSGIANQYYCGGIDVHSGKNWRVSKCTFKNIYSPDNALSEGAIHFWNNSANTLVEQNVIINCDRGIMFGLDNSPHINGIIRNNMLYVTRDVGIYLCYADGAKVYNNTVYTKNNYPNAIEYRFEQTLNCEIINNLTNKAISSRNGGKASLQCNVTNAIESWFENAAIGNLHLSGDIESVVNKGVELTEITNDIDGDDRNSGLVDIGADEI